MTNKPHIFLVLASCMLFILFCNSCASIVDADTSLIDESRGVSMKEPPLWVFSPEKVFPDSKYLKYVGYGADRNSAEVSALNGLSAIFGRNVISDTGLSTRMEEVILEGNSSFIDHSVFDQEIISKVNVNNLIGVKIKGFWTDANGTWYSVAVIDRAEVADLYKILIQKNNDIISKLTESANKDFYSINSMRAYDFAQEIAIENNNNLEKLFVIDYNSAKAIGKDVAAPEVYGEKQYEIAKEIPVYISIKGDVDDVYKSAFLDALSEFGFSGSTDSNVRYVIDGAVSYTMEETSDGKTSKCYYDFDSSFTDTKDGINVFPINIHGRQAHRTASQAKSRAVTDISNKIQSTFNEEFSKYLESDLRNN